MTSVPGVNVGDAETKGTTKPEVSAGVTGSRMDLLRFSTAGSVDDGKSTLIGRLLYDSKAVFEDQLEWVAGASRKYGEEGMNLALLTDGLRAEREQKITIDVAYRYFATPKRKFIIADTPGHVQYTRNMVTGASTADLAIILVDARKGVVTQSKRHAFIASLLGIPHVIVAVNKMDLVDWSEEVFEEIRDDFRRFAKDLTLTEVSFLPISALLGDNVVSRSERMPWFGGAPLLHTLETVNLRGRRNAIDFRFPVQYVIRPNQDFRGLAGTVASGSIRPGEEVVVLPSGWSTRVRRVDTFEGPRTEARVGEAVVLSVEDELDISRGDMLVRPKNVPSVANRFEAYLCWLDEAPLEPSRSYLLLHTTRDVQAFVEKVEYRVDVDTLHREPASTLSLNEIGRVEITASQPVFFDSYRVNTATGSFVLVDAHTHGTVAAGMIRGEVRRVEPVPPPSPPSADVRPVSPHVTWEGWNVPRPTREIRNGYGAHVLWFTGMSGAGKSTIARAVERCLFQEGVDTVLLDGDQLRHGLCGDLAFSQEDRMENIRRVAEVTQLLFEHGLVVLCSFVSPFRDDRRRVRARFPEDRFLEIHVRAPLEVVRARDPKGLYRKEANGSVGPLPGSVGVYEAPESPEVEVDTSETSVDQAVAEILRRVGNLSPVHGVTRNPR